MPPAPPARRGRLPALSAAALLLALAMPPRAGALQGFPTQMNGATMKIDVVGAAELKRIRESHLDFWNELQAGEATGLERFAATVQRVVDHWAAYDGALSEAQRERLLLDDLVDLFVADRHAPEKALLMATRPLLGERALREGKGDLSGFAEAFQAGDGRYRHFALNAAAAYAVPELLVELAARLRGGDLLSRSKDSEADLATNAIGREFARLLSERPLRELGDGESVRSWLLARFGPGGRL